jgi:hypothetical protein
MAELWQSLRVHSGRFSPKRKHHPTYIEIVLIVNCRASQPFYTTELLQSTIVIIQPVTISSGNASPHQFRDLVSFLTQYAWSMAVLDLTTTAPHDELGKEEKQRLRAKRYQPTTAQPPRPRSRL